MTGTFNRGLRALGIQTSGDSSTLDGFTWGVRPSITFGREPYITDAVITMVPGAIYRARVVVPSLASYKEIAEALQKKGFADVSVWPVKAPPADWPADQRKDESGFMESTVLVQGRWAGGAETFDSAHVPHADFKGKWIETMPPAAHPPTITPKKPSAGTPATQPPVPVVVVSDPPAAPAPADSPRMSGGMIALLVAVPAVLIVAGRRHG